MDQFFIFLLLVIVLEQEEKEALYWPHSGKFSLITTEKNFVVTVLWSSDKEIGNTKQSVINL